MNDSRYLKKTKMLDYEDPLIADLIKNKGRIRPVQYKGNSFYGSFESM